MTNSDFPTDQTSHQFHDLYTELDLHRIMSGFHGAFATGVASQQGTLTLPDTWFRPPIWDLLMLQLLRPNSSNLPCLYSTFHLEYPLVLSRFCLSNVVFTSAENNGNRRRPRFCPHLSPAMRLNELHINSDIHKETIHSLRTVSYELHMSSCAVYDSFNRSHIYLMSMKPSYVVNTNQNIINKEYKNLIKRWIKYKIKERTMKN